MEEYSRRSSSNPEKNKNISRSSSDLIKSTAVQLARAK
jgi:hypothetical protein